MTLLHFKTLPYWERNLYTALMPNSQLFAVSVIWTSHHATNDSEKNLRYQFDLTCSLLSQILEVGTW